MDDSANAQAMIDAIRKHERCRSMLAKSMFRRAGPTPQYMKAALVARSAAIRALVA